MAYALWRGCAAKAVRLWAVSHHALPVAQTRKRRSQNARPFEDPETELLVARATTSRARGAGAGGRERRDRRSATASGYIFNFSCGFFVFPWRFEPRWHFSIFFV